MKLLANSETHFSVSAIRWKPFEASFTLIKPNLRNRVLTLTCDSIAVESLSVIRWLASDKVQMEALWLDSLQIVFTGDSVSSKPIKETEEDDQWRLSIPNMHARHVLLQWKNRTTSELHRQISIDTITARINLSIGEPRIINLHDTRIALQGIAMQQGNNIHRLRVKALAYQQHNLTFDSIQLIPQLSETEFSNQLSLQASRYTLTIPNATLYDLKSINNITQWRAHKLAMSFDFEAYSDKRPPGQTKPPKPLPVHIFQQLPLRLHIDSVVLNNSNITYREFATKGDSVGNISFNNLNVTCAPFHNHNRGAVMVLSASAAFMNSGDLEVKFTIPPDSATNNTVEGRLSNFNMESLNRMLVPAMRIKVDSGKMAALSFYFAYNYYRSDGRVTARYKNLSIVSLKETSNAQQAVNWLKTLLIKTFILKDAETEHWVDHQGKILFYRDPRKSIFHYWWKSLFTGITDAFDLSQFVSNGAPEGK